MDIKEEEIREFIRNCTRGKRADGRWIGRKRQAGHTIRHYITFAAAHSAALEW